MESDIDDIEGTASSPIGSVEYSFSDIQFINIDYDSVAFNADPDTTQVSALIGGVTLELNFAYGLQLLSWPYTQDAGSGQIVVTNASTELAFSSVYNAADGTLGFRTDTVDVSISEFDVQLQGGSLSVLIDTIVTILGDTLAPAVAGLAEDLIFDIIAYYGSEVLFDSYSCRGGLCLDTRLARAPTVAATYLSNLYGGTYYVEDAQGLYVAPTDYTTLPETINEKMFQCVFGPACLSTYLGAIYANGSFVDATGAADAASVAAALPEFAAAFPGEAAALAFSLSAEPAVEILYSALRITFRVRLDVTPEGSAGGVALDLEVVTAGELDFEGNHGDPGPVTTHHSDLSIELTPYSVGADVADSSVGAVTVTDELLAWAQDTFFEVVYDGAWEQVLKDEQFQIFAMNRFDFVDRAIVYTPEYVAVTFDAILAE